MIVWQMLYQVSHLPHPYNILKKENKLHNDFFKRSYAKERIHTDISFSCEIIQLQQDFLLNRNREIASFPPRLKCHAHSHPEFYCDLESGVSKCAKEKSS